MRTRLIRQVAFPVLVLCVTSLGPAVGQAEAQPQQAPKVFVERNPQVPAELDQARAKDVRNELQQLMERYPPSLGQILKLDPGLLSNPTYLAPYPALTAYLQRHPEIVRNADYFLEFVNPPYNYYREQGDTETQMRRAGMDLTQDVLVGMMVIAIVITIALSLGWLIRYVVGHRRWLRATKIQTDVHSRLLERFTANDELLAYIQSPTARTFLQSVPVTADPVASAGIAAPISRILWSLQAGCVLAAAGLGLLSIKQYMYLETQQVLLVFGVLGLSLGVGFVVAAAASYLLSQRLGLLELPDKAGSSPGA